MRTNIRKILAHLENHAPFAAAESWDNQGLLLGDLAWKTKGVVLSVDLTAEALRAAVKKRFGLIVTHHPALFPGKGGLRGLVAEAGARGRESLPALLLQAAQNQIGVAALHTSFDQCALEVVSKISKSLKISPLGRLFESPANTLMKLAVFVPKTHLAGVREALCRAGAGHIGHYDSCSFSAPGEGTFRGSTDTHPFLGKPGQLEKAEEFRLETVFPRGLQRGILKALLEAHPYEEVAYDLYPLAQKPASQGIVKGLGYGFWGDFVRSKPFSDVARSVRRLFQVVGFRVTDPLPARVRRVAFAAGKGSAFAQHAVDVGCDLFITGEVSYHDALSAKRSRMAVLELGHRESECFFAPVVQDWLAEMGVPSVSVNNPTQKLC